MTYPTMLGQYRIEREIGHGGMGSVYEATDTESGERIALKRLSNTMSAIYRELFVREAESLAELTRKLGRNDCYSRMVGDVFEDAEGNLYLPMEYVEGQTLNHLGKLGEEEAFDLMKKVLAAMQKVHDGGLIHRDIKPQNIMLRTNGKVAIIDFGIAKDAKVGSTGHTVGQIVGTDGYMSPEQVLGGSVDKRVDIYALGATLYYLLTGHTAIEEGGNSHETKVNILKGDIRADGEISERAMGIVRKAMNRNMTLRYQTAADFAQALDKEAPAADDRPRRLKTYGRITVGREGPDMVVGGGMSVHIAAPPDHHGICRSGRRTAADGI